MNHPIKWLSGFLLPMVFVNLGWAAGTGGFQFSPSISAEQVFTDNLYYQPQNEIDSWITVIAPKLALGIDGTTLAGSISVSAESGIYSYSSDDNYTDTLLDLEGNYEFNHNNQIQLQASYGQNHDERGTGLSEGPKAFLIDGPIEFDDSSLRAKYIYGSQTSRGKLVFKGAYFKRDYTNFQQLTEGKSHETIYGGASFFLRMGKVTRLLVDGQIGSVDYIDDPEAIDGIEDSLDRQFQKLLMGVTWDVTSKTQGTVKAGYRFIDFKDGDREDFSGPSWEMNVVWTPMSYSRFQFTSLQEDRESTGDASFINYRETRAEWSLDWTARITSRVFLGMGQKNFEDSNPNRKDDLTDIGAGIDFKVRRWLTLGLDVEHSAADSTINVFDFDRNQISVSVNASI